MDNIIKRNYGIMSETYDETYYKENDDNKKIKNIIKKTIFKNNVRSVLELGCGTGYWLEFISRFKIDKITGYDFSEKMLEIAKKKSGNFKVQKVLLPDEFKADSYYDLIMCNFTLSSFLNINKINEMFIKIKSSLSDNGKFILVENKIPEKELKNGVNQMILKTNENWGGEIIRCEYNLFSHKWMKSTLSKFNLKIDEYIGISDDIYCIISSHS